MKFICEWVYWKSYNNNFFKKKPWIKWKKITLKIEIVKKTLKNFSNKKDEKLKEKCKSLKKKRAQKAKNKIKIENLHKCVIINHYRKIEIKYIF